MKLTILAKKLYHLNLHREAAQILKLASKEIFAHISGPSGSGKTTLMEEIASLHPDVVAKDLDEFDEKATEEMGLDLDWKQTSWSEELQKEHYKVKQGLLDHFIEENAGKRILLVGLHEEGGDALHFNPRHKILIDTSPTESMRRRVRRDKKLSPTYEFWKDQGTMASELEESERIVQCLTSKGYTTMSKEEILDLFSE
jgi:energy-coupling factor transporter ATP-binding protein EcfA2